MMQTVRRFSKKNGSDRDCDWIDSYCRSNKIDFKRKMKELKNYLSSIDWIDALGSELRAFSIPFLRMIMGGEMDALETKEHL